jgi:DNA-binding response OmpR family regulator
MDSGKTALIIEDDYSIYIVLELILKSKEISSIHADSLTKTRSLITTISPDIIFLDQRLPDGYGFDIIPDLRKNYPDARIIAMTAEYVPENKNENIRSADTFLEKPFVMNDVLKSLND